MLTRQRTITEQFSQRKSSRSLKSKRGIAEVESTIEETVVHSAKRLRSATRQGSSAKKSAVKGKQGLTRNVSIEDCFKKVARKSDAPVQVQTEVTGEPQQSTSSCEPDFSDYPKFHKAEDLIKRTLLKDKGNTPSKEENNTLTGLSPSVSHKVEVFNDCLKLPVAYETLLSHFIAADRCIAMMDNRNETITFSKLKSSVETSTKRTFTEETFGQLLSVFPGCYKLTYSQTHYNSANVELTVRADCMAGLDKEDLQLSPQSHLTVTLMKKRETVFRQSLMKLVAESHSSYLKSLSPGIAVKLDISKLRRWHPNFPLETATPVITAAQLPNRPGGGTPRHWTAKDILERYAKNNPHLAKFVEAATKESTNAPSVAAPSTPNSFKIIKSGPFAGLREDLVAKVRERERRDKDLAAIVDPVADLNRIRRSRLPQLIRIIRGLFFRGTKSVMLKDLLATVRYSWTAPISEDEVKATFDLLIATCPQWIRVLIVTISPEPLVQIESDTNINTLISSLPVVC